MGGLTSPPVIPIGTTPGEASGPGIAQTNRESYGANIAANWTFVGAGTSVLAAAWENGFAPALVTAVAGTDHLTGSLCATYNTVAGTATDRVNTMSAYVMAPLTGVQSPQCRLQFTLTAGPTYSIDVDPRSGVLIAQAGNPTNPQVQRLVVPLLGTTENVVVYRISFSFKTGGIATGTPWFWPRTDGGAAGAVIFGGTQLEGMVSAPSPFVTPNLTGTAGARLIGQSPRQTTTPQIQHKQITASPYVVDAYADQDTWLECTLLAGTTINLPIVTGNFPDMPTGSRLLITQDAAAIGGITTVSGAANAIIAPGGVTASYTSLTFPSTDFPNVTQMMLVKTGNANEWIIVATSGGGSSGITPAALAASSGSSLVGFIQAGTGAVATTLQANDRLTFNLQQYGGKGDGSTDNTTPFNNAISQINSLGGGDLVVPGASGKYFVASTVTLKPNVNIVLQGATIHFTGGDTSLFQFVGASEAQPLNGSLSGIGTIESSVANSGYAVRLRNFSNFVIEKGVAISAFNRGAKADWGIGLRIKNKCTITGCTRAVETGGNDALPAGIAAGIRSGTYATSPFMDSVSILRSGFSQNVIDINDMGSLNSLGGIEIKGNTFFESAITPIAGKTNFVRISGRRGIDVSGGNWWEAQNFKRSCLVFSTFDIDGTSRGAPEGASVKGNYMLVQGGDVATIGVEVDRLIGGEITANSFCVENAAGGYAISLGDTTSPCTVGINAYNTLSGGAWTAEISQATDYNLLIDPTNNTHAAFTPVVNIAGSTTGITYTQQLGYYTRNANTITIWIYIILSNKGTNVGNVTITGLPFTAASPAGGNGAGVYSTYYANFDAGLTTAPFGNIAITTATLSMFKNGAGAAAALANTDLTNTSGFYLTGSYNAATNINP